jgi:L-fuconolactonase
MTGDGRRETELTICDPHIHLRTKIPPGPELYSIADLRADLASGGHRVTEVVYIECGQRYDPELAFASVGETLAAASYDPSGELIAGIVPFADLSSGAAISEELDAHIAASSRVCGIRHMTHWDPNDLVPTSHVGSRHLLRSDAASEAIEQVTARHLALDLFIYFHQLADVSYLAHCHPDATIVLDHFGAPLGIGEYSGEYYVDVLATWRDSMLEIATFPNVMVKLGGAAMPSMGLGLDLFPQRPTASQVAEVFAPTLLWCIETFGSDRCMFESNFPVDRVGIDYGTLWDAFKLLTQHLPTEERTGLFRRNARTTYRLQPTTGESASSDG